VCDLLQHGSTIFGALALWLWYRNWLRGANASTRKASQGAAGPLSDRARRDIVLALLAGAAVIGFAHAHSVAPLSWDTLSAGPGAWTSFIRAAVLAGMLALWVECVLLGVLWRVLAVERTPVRQQRP
jgi:hypothetical protein